MHADLGGGGTISYLDTYITLFEKKHTWTLCPAIYDRNTVVSD